MLTRLVRDVTQRTLIALASARPPSLVLVGDSITAWAPWPEVNLAVPRVETRLMAPQVDAALAVRARCISILAGANDIVNQIKSEEEIAEDIAALVRRARGTRVVVTLTLRQTAERAERIDRVNALARALVEPFAVVLDVNPLLAPNGYLEPGFTVDGVHLSRAGYASWWMELVQLVTPPREAKHG